MKVFLVFLVFFGALILSPLSGTPENAGVIRLIFYFVITFCSLGCICEQFSLCCARLLSLPAYVAFPPICGPSRSQG